MVESQLIYDVIQLGERFFKLKGREKKIEIYFDDEMRQFCIGGNLIF